MNRRTAPVLVVVALQLAACSPEPAAQHQPPAAAQPWFTASLDSGIDFVHRSGAGAGHYYYPESMGSGVAACDLDGDGDIDLYFVQSGRFNEGPAGAPDSANRLYLNDGQGRFRDASSESGAADLGYGMGANCADVDGDGDYDLYVTNVGANALYLNDGDGTFVDVSEQSGTADPGWGVSSSFFDADRDGDLDLFVVNYLNWSAEAEVECRADDGQREYCGPSNYRAPAVDVFYINQGDGRFLDATDRAGIGNLGGNGLGVVSADLNADGHQDVFVANDQMANFLWLGDGKGAFREGALIAGVAFNRNGQAEAGMGVIADDIDADADPDLLLTHLYGESNTLYLNQYDASLPGVFDDASASSGIAAPSLPFTGFGVGAIDFDQDGLLDLFVANGRVVRGLPLHGDDPYAEPDLILRGSALGRFKPMDFDQDRIASGRGAAFADLDGDLDIDVIVANRDAAPNIWLNAGASGAAIMLDLRESNGSPAIGARVRLSTGTVERWRWLVNGNSYASANPPLIHFGLGPQPAASTATVYWQDGESSVYDGLQPGRVHRLQR